MGCQPFYSSHTTIIGHYTRPRKFFTPTPKSPFKSTYKVHVDPLHCRNCLPWVFCTSSVQSLSLSSEFQVEARSRFDCTRCIFFGVIEKEGKREEKFFFGTCSNASSRTSGLEFRIQSCRFRSLQRHGFSSSHCTWPGIWARGQVKGVFWVQTSTHYLVPVCVMASWSLSLF